MPTATYSKTLTCLAARVKFGAQHEDSGHGQALVTAIQTLVWSPFNRTVRRCPSDRALAVALRTA